MELKVTKLCAFDGIELKEATYRKRTFPEHFHDSYSLVIIEHGVERLLYGKKEILAHANTVMVANPYEIHAHGFFDNDAWKYKAVYISTDLMLYVQQKSGLFKNKTVWFPQQLFNDAHLYNTLQYFHQAPTKQKINSLYDICCYLVRTYAIERPEPAFKPMAAITDATGYLKENVPNKLNIETIALSYGMDKYKFIRLFKKQTGLTPVSYLLLHRINAAKQLMTTSQPLVEVALEAGFYDQSHFIHYFKKYTGISPLLYRKNIVTEE